MKTVALIPARGGSKGIPRKNVKELCGMPLLYWSIVVAKRATGIEQVFVSTDDAEIAQVSRKHGAVVIDRPAEISGDTASSESALLHACDVIEKHHGGLPERVVFLQATSPIREVSDLEQALEQFNRDQLDSLICCATREHSFWWMKEQAGRVRSLNYDYRKRPRRQDRGKEDEYFLETGSFYITRTTILRELKNRLGGKIGIYGVPLWKGFEIDDPHDFELIESVMRAFKLDRALAPQ